MRATIVDTDDGDRFEVHAMDDNTGPILFTLAWPRRLPALGGQVQFAVPRKEAQKLIRFLDRALTDSTET